MSQAPSAAELEWIQMRQEMDSMRNESAREKLVRKVTDNPMVPFGCLATACALSYGLYSFRKGNVRMSQMMMRARIAAQGFTVVALIVGVGFSLTKK